MREGGNLCLFGGMISQPPRLTTCITLESFPVYNRKDLSDEEPLLKQTGFICDQNLEVTMILSSVNILYLYVKLFLYLYFLTLLLLKFKFN